MSSGNLRALWRTLWEPGMGTLWEHKERPLTVRARALALLHLLASPGCRWRCGRSDSQSFAAPETRPIGDGMCAGSDSGFAMAMSRWIQRAKACMERFPIQQGRADWQVLRPRSARNWGGIGFGFGFGFGFCCCGDGAVNSNEPDIAWSGCVVGQNGLADWFWGQDLQETEEISASVLDSVVAAMASLPMTTNNAGTGTKKWGRVVSFNLSDTPYLEKATKAVTSTARFSQKLLWSTGKAAWIAGTSLLVLVVPLIIEMDREQQVVDLENQQSGLLGTPAAPAPPASTTKWGNQTPRWREQIFFLFRIDVLERHSALDWERDYDLSTWTERPEGCTKGCKPGGRELGNEKKSVPGRWLSLH